MHLILLISLKKLALELHQLIVQDYSQHTLGCTQCNGWFNKSKSGNCDVRNEKRGNPPKKFENDEVKALFDEGGAEMQKYLAKKLDSRQSTGATCFKTMGKILKVGRKVPHYLTEK